MKTVAWKDYQSFIGAIQEQIDNVVMNHEADIENDIECLDLALKIGHRFSKGMRVAATKAAASYIDLLREERSHQPA